MGRPLAGFLKLHSRDRALAIAVLAAAGAAQAAPVSINSTSQNFGTVPGTAVTQQPTPKSANSLKPAAGSGRAGYQILGGNDLGMHCGDLDTRVSSILPPFNVLHAVVLKKGQEPRILGPVDVDVV
nr:hypothetical protein [Gammaproteobacteria bacterium]